MQKVYVAWRLFFDFLKIEVCAPQAATTPLPCDEAMTTPNHNHITREEGGHMSSTRENEEPVDQKKLIKKLKHVVHALKQQNEELRAKCEHNQDTEKVFVVCNSIITQFTTNHPQNFI